MYKCLCDCAFVCLLAWLIVWSFACLFGWLRARMFVCMIVWFVVLVCC